MPAHLHAVNRLSRQPQENKNPHLLQKGAGFKPGQRADYFYRPLLQQKKKSDICRISFVNSGDGGT